LNINGNIKTTIKVHKKYKGRYSVFCSILCLNFKNTIIFGSMLNEIFLIFFIESNKKNKDKVTEKITNKRVYQYLIIRLDSCSSLS